MLGKRSKNNRVQELKIKAEEKVRIKNKNMQANYKHILYKFKI